MCRGNKAAAPNQTVCYLEGGLMTTGLRGPPGPGFVRFLRGKECWLSSPILPTHTSHEERAGMQ